MKLIISFLLLAGFTNQIHCQDSTANFYNIQFGSLENGYINLSAYNGKQIVVVNFNAASPNTVQLLSLDSLFRHSNGTVEIIAVPVQDFGTAISADSLTSLLRNNLGLSYPLAAISYAQKNAGVNQNPLFSWLTHVNANSHLDDDVTEDGEIYVISSSGILYGLLKGIIAPASSDIVQNVLGNQP